MARSVEPHKHKHKKNWTNAQKTYKQRKRSFSHGFLVICTRAMAPETVCDQSRRTPHGSPQHGLQRGAFLHDLTYTADHSRIRTTTIKWGNWVCTPTPKPVFYVQQKKTAVLLAQSRAAQRQIKTIAVLECASTQKQQQKWNRKRWERKWIQSKNTGILQ